MTASLSLKFSGKTYDDASKGILDAISQLRSSVDGQPKVLGKVMREYLDHVADQIANKHSGDGGGGTLAKVSGKAMRSVVKSVRVTGSSWESLRGSIGGVSYLGIHEYGGTIRSKGKLLTIPLPAAKARTGQAPPFARQWKNTFVATSRAGNLLIFQRRGREIIPLYLLVERVTIPPRLGMRETLRSQIPYFLDRATTAIAREFTARLSK
jgi:hypothetical protein